MIKEIMENAVFESELEPGHMTIERILFVDKSINLVITIDVQKKDAMPTMKKLSELEQALQTKDSRFISYLPAPLFRKFSAKDEAIIEKRWNYIKDMVGNEPDIYYSHYRHQMVLKIIDENKTTKTTVYKLFRLFWQGGKTPSALLPRFFKCGNKGQKKKYLKKCGPKNNTGVLLDEESIECLIKGYKHFKLSEGFSLRDAYKRTMGYYFKTGYQMNEFGNLEPIIPDDIPSIYQFSYHGENAFSTKTKLLAKYGEKNFNLNHRSVAQKKERPYGPGEVVQIDACIADIFLVSRFNRNLVIGRPVVYMVPDVSTSYLGGFYVGLVAPSWEGAKMALYNLYRDKKELYGQYGIYVQDDDDVLASGFVPNNIIADRGEFEGKLPENLVKNLHINKLILPPYRADWKGAVEVTFKKYNGKVIHWLDGAITKEQRERGDKDVRLDANLDLHQFSQIIGLSVKYFNDKHMPNYKRTDEQIRDDVPAIPSQLWKWGIANSTGSLRTFDENIVKLNLMHWKECTLSYRGLYFQNRRYSCSEYLESGIYEHLRENESIKRVISYDPRDMSCVYVNEGDRFTKLYSIEDTMNDLFYEEIEVLNQANNEAIRMYEKADIQNSISLFTNIDAIEAEANKLSPEGKNSIKDVRENRKNEKLTNNDVEKWAIDNIPKVSTESTISNYIPEPKFIKET
jgi:putative transposase